MKIKYNELNEILSVYKFNPSINFDKETNQYEIIINEIDAQGFGDTIEEAIEITLDNIIDLKDDFFEQIDKYIRYEKYLKQYPYYLRIKHCVSEDELIKTLGLKNATNVNNN